MRKSIRFVGVGIVSTLAYLAISMSLVVLFKTDAKLTNVVAYLAGMGISYLGHRHITFNSRAAMSREVMRFTVTHGVNLLLSTLLIYLLVDRLGVNRFAALALATVLVMGISFMIMQIWVFRDREAHRPA